jgi:hypothetical protein
MEHLDYPQKKVYIEVDPNAKPILGHTLYLKSI